MTPPNSRKSLRRKPPPPLSGIHDIHKLLPPHPETDIENTNHIFPLLDQDSPQMPSQTARFSADSSLDLSYADDLMWSYDSPRLKGPQELPFDEYSSPKPLPQAILTEFLEYSPLPLPQGTPKSSLPTNQQKTHQTSMLSPGLRRDSSSPSYSPETAPARRPIPVRKFQNLLLSGTSPFVTREDSSAANSLPNSPLLNKSQRYKTHTLASGQSPPYPVVCDPDFSDSEVLTKEDEMLPRDIHGTPSRIPSLMDDLPSSYQNQANRFPSRSPDSKFFNFNVDPNRSYPSSPELPGKFYGSSTPSSPTKSPSMSRPFTVNSYSDFVGNRSSRSPSPKKTTKSSPSNSRNPYPIGDSYLDLYANDDDLRTPRWSLIEPEYADYHYDEDENQLQPNENPFDYAMLPELPKQDNASPTHSGTFKTTLSLLKNDSEMQYSPTVRRKFDDLPPVPLDLPLLPFSSSSLSRQHFFQCGAVWSLKNIHEWCLKLSCWVHGQDITEKQLRKALVKLLVFHKRNIPIDIIGKNANHIIEALQTAGGLVMIPKEQEGASTKKILCADFKTNAVISGVLVDLTVCYCHDSDHEHFTENMLKCYSSQCFKNKFIEQEKYRHSINISELVLNTDWATHWQLTSQEINNDTLDSKKQSFLFDLIKFEQTFIQRGELFISLAGPEFLNVAEAVIGKDGSSFSLNEFGAKLLKSARSLVSIHKSSLLEPLLEILVSNGKFIEDIVGIAKLYYDWSKVVRSPLLEYMSAVPMIEYLLRNEGLKNWDSLLSKQQRIKDSQVNGNLLLMSTFNSRYQQLPLQLSDIRKFYDEQEDEYSELSRAIEAIKSLGTTVNQMKVHADNIHSLEILQKHLTWKTNIFQPNINLTSSKRKFYYRGDLSKKGDLKINTNTVHVIVLDNYFLITERSRSQRVIKYKVIETPILIDFLIVENREKESGITTKVGTSTSLSKNTDGEEDTFLYPFKVRYAGRKHESHTFLASSEKERNTWITVLEKARFNLMKRVSPLAPYDLKLIDNCFFSYEQPPSKVKLPTLPPNDPIKMLSESTNRILKERGISLDIFSPKAPKHMIERKRVQYVETCIFGGTKFYFLGTNAGVFCTDGKQRWKMILNTTNVTKLTIIPSLNVALVLGNRILRHYPLRLLVEVYYERKDGLTSFPTTNDEIVFYEVGKHKEMLTLFMAKKSTGETRFKVFAFETDINGTFTLFSLIKEFYIAGQCYGISVFNTSIAVHTERGFEVMKLGTLLPRTIPELPDGSSKKIDAYGRKNGLNHTDAIRRAIAHCAPMGMFKLRNNKEFLLVYKDFAVFVNKAGSLSRTAIVRFDFRPKSIAFVENNLFLCCEEVIEVWSISDSTNGKNTLIQVIPNKGHHMANSESLIFSTTNPQNQGLQMVFQLEARKRTI